MGIPITPPNPAPPPAHDMANAVVTGAITADGNSSTFYVYGWFNVSCWGTFAVASAPLQKTYDGGTTWIPVISPFTGAAITVAAAGSIAVFEPERGVSYRLAVDWTSGTYNYRFSASGRTAMSQGF